MSKYFFITLKRYIEQAIMFPFVVAGKAIAMLRPLDSEYDFFMFFPGYGIGGAEKVNGDIVAALPDKKIIIFFTRRSPDDKLLHLFKKPNVTIKEINKWTDNKLVYWASFIQRGMCACYINRQKKQPVVFNGQCNFAYKLLPHLDKGILKTELIHNSQERFAWVTFPYVPFIDRRITFANCIINRHNEYYDSLGMPGTYKSRWQKITNCVPVPPQYMAKQRTGKLKVYYAGRGGYQKHLELVFAITRKCLEENAGMEFHFAGTFEDEIPGDIRNRINWHGSIGNDEEMYRLHHSMDVLLMTSRFEGFPLVISEAMSCGVAIVATAVDGIPEHIKDGINGYLMYITDDESIVADGITHLKSLAASGALLEAISRNNYEYAAHHFTKEVFIRSYRSAFGLRG